MKCICGGKIDVYRTLPVNEAGNRSVDYPVTIFRYKKCDKCSFTYKTVEDVSVDLDFFENRRFKPNIPVFKE